MSRLSSVNTLSRTVPAAGSPAAAGSASDVSPGHDGSTFVVIIATVIVLGILTYIVPQFGDIFKDFGAKLPGMTLWLIDAGNFVKYKWWKGLIILDVAIITPPEARDPALLAKLDAVAGRVLTGRG